MRAYAIITKCCDFFATMLVKIRTDFGMRVILVIYMV